MSDARLMKPRPVFWQGSEQQQTKTPALPCRGVFRLFLFSGVFFFAVFASVYFILRIGQEKDLVEFLFD